MRSAADGRTQSERRPDEREKIKTTTTTTTTTAGRTRSKAHLHFAEYKKISGHSSDGRPISGLLIL
eukprot:7566229-Pyramimonas_sp.AAC.1